MAGNGNYKMRLDPSNPNKLLIDLDSDEEEPKESAPPFENQEKPAVIGKDTFLKLSININLFKKYFRRTKRAEKNR